MRRMWILAAIVFSVVNVARATDENVKRILDEYQAYPYDRMGPMRRARLDVLRQLQSIGADKVVPDLDQALQNEKDPGRRAELVETLRNFPTKPAADVLTRSLGDTDSAVRLSALHAIRLMSRRVERLGEAREQRGGEFEPKVPGLVPVIIKAMDDPVPLNRQTCLYVLADTLDPAAIDRIRAALKDPNQDVRFHAACFLTEFKDNSGIGELKVALVRLRDNRDDVMWFGHVSRVVASLERITDRSVGDLPPNPMYSSQSNARALAAPEYARIVNAWIEYWKAQPTTAKG